MKKIFPLVLLICMAVVLCLPAVISVSPVRAAATVPTTAGAPKPPSLVAQEGECADKGDCNPCDLVAVVVRFANNLTLGAGGFDMFMFAFGGIVMLTAYGNEARITAGKNVIITTVVGIFIIFSAWTIINVFIGAFFGLPSNSAAVRLFGDGKNGTVPWNVCPESGNVGSPTPNSSVKDPSGYN